MGLRQTHVRTPVSRRTQLPSPCSCEMAAYFAASANNRMIALDQSVLNKAPVRVAPTSFSTYKSPLLDRVQTRVSFSVKNPCFGATSNRKQALVSTLQSTELSLAWGIRPVSERRWIYGLELTYDTTTALMQLQQEAAAAGKALVTREEANKLRAAGGVKNHAQLEQQQANLAAARKAAPRPGWGSLVGAASNSVRQLGFYGQLNDCGLDSACLEQKQVACSKPCQVSAAAPADVDSLADDYEGVKENGWQTLLADPAWAATIHGLQCVAL